MSYFPESQAEFERLYSPESYDFGMHSQREPRAGGVGIKIGEMQFDPELHDPTSINPGALLGIALGEPHVDIVLPNRSLKTSIVIDADPKDRAEVAFLQRELAYQISETMKEALPQVGDDLTTYNIGPVNTGEKTWRDIDELVDVSDSRKAAEVMGRIVLDSDLTFVLSSFNNLPIDELNAMNSHAVGIKVNHQADFEIPVGMEIAGIKTERDRLIANQRLGEYHRRLDERIVGAGLKLAHIVLQKPRGLRQVIFDEHAADLELAKAIENLDSLIR